MDFAKFIEDVIVIGILKPITVLILSLAIVYFLWNIAEGIRKGDNPDELAAIKTKAFWGVVAIAIMVSLWGLVDILVNTFLPGSSVGPGSGGLPLIPSVEGGSSGVGGGTSDTSTFEPIGGGFDDPGSVACYSYDDNGQCSS